VPLSARRHCATPIFVERLRNSIEQLQVDYEGQSINLCIYPGIAQLTEEMSRSVKWLQSGDLVLYESRRGGRKRVTVHRPGIEPAA